MNRDLQLAIEFDNAPKELQEAAGAAYVAEKAYEQNLIDQEILKADSMRLLQVSNDASAVYNKILKAWSDNKKVKAVR